MSQQNENKNKKVNIKLIAVDKPDMGIDRWSKVDVKGNIDGFSKDNVQGLKQSMKNNLQSFNPFSSTNSLGKSEPQQGAEPAAAGLGGSAESNSDSPKVTKSLVHLIQVAKPAVHPTATQHTGKHFDIVLGIDIHWTLTPFGIYPLPHPFIGIIFDVMDYIKFTIPVPSFVRKVFSGLPESIPMGGSIYVHGRHKATTTTSVMGVAIPFKHVSSLIPAYTIPSPVEAPHEGEVYYGSETVLGQGSKMSGDKPQQVLTCMGLPFGMTMLPAMPAKPKKNPLAYFAFYNNFASMYVQINTGNPVLVGGSFVPHVYTLGEMAMRFAGMFLMKKLSKALGKGAKVGLTKMNNSLLKKGPLSKFKMAQALSRKLCRLGLDPVNFVTGAMNFEWDDFEIGGNTPLSWKNAWLSDQLYDRNQMGTGVFNNYDLYIIPDHALEVAAWIHPDEYQPLPLPIPDLGTEEAYFRTQQVWQSRPDEQTWIIRKGLNTYTYKHFVHIDGEEVYKISHIDYHDGTHLDFAYTGRALLLQSIKDQSGRRIETMPNKENTRIAEVYYVSGALRELQVRYQYDERGNLTCVWDQHDKAIYFEYDEHNRIVKRINRNKMQYTWRYDNQGRVIYTTGLKSVQVGTISYHPELGYNRVTYPFQDKKTETYYYDENNLIYKERNGEGGETWHDYTPHKEKRMSASPEGRTRAYTYDEWGNIITYHTPDGEEYKYTHNLHGQLTARFSPSGASEIWVYDDQQRLLSYTNKLGELTQYEYEGEMKLPSSSTDAWGINTQYRYNEQMQLIYLSNSLGTEQHWRYDDYGKLQIFNPQSSMQLHWHRDKMGRVTQLSQTGVPDLEIAYDAYDLPISVSDGQREWLMEYTPMGSLKRQERRDRISKKQTQVLSFFYDVYENLLSITNEKEEVYRFVHNKNNEIIQETGFDGIVKKYLRNKDGLVTQSLFGEDQSIYYQYDLAGRLVHTDYQDGSWEVYHYDSSGLLIRADNENSRVDFARNAMGLITQERQGEHHIEYTYNKEGQLTRLSSSLGAEVVHDYDSLGQLTHIQAYNAQQGQDNTWESLLQYTSQGQLQQQQMSGGVESSFEYDPTGMPISQKVTHHRHTSLHKKYYWSAGNRLHYVEDLLHERGTQYKYDLYGSLSRARYADGSMDYKSPDEIGNLYETKSRKDRIYDQGGRLLKDKKWYYRYDNQGNLILKSKRNIIGFVAEKPTEESFYESYLRNTSKDWNIEENWQEANLPDADKHGPPSPAQWERGDWKYAWYANGMLKSVMRPDGYKVSMEYDALGRRTAKIFQEEITRYLWDGNRLLHEWKYKLNLRPKLVLGEDSLLQYDREEPIENLVTWVYKAGSLVPCGKIVGADSYSIVSDYIDRPIQAYDKLGKLIWQTDYDIYGKAKNLRGDKTFIPFRQLGQYEDEELEGLYYNRFRYYDSESGLYISKDPIGLAGNNPTLYAYVSDTNKFVDPWGLDENPFDFLKEALRQQGINPGDQIPSNLKQTWEVGTTRYEVRIHPANPEYGQTGDIFRVAKKEKTPWVVSPEGVVKQGQGSGMSYLGTDGKWYSESELKEFHGKGNNRTPNPDFKEAGSRKTHIEISTYH